jgi:hypothetical protein
MARIALLMTVEDAAGENDLHDRLPLGFASAYDASGSLRTARNACSER